MLVRYLSAVACVLAGLVVAVWMDGLLPDTTVFLAVVVVVAWFSGLTPGLLSALLATVAIDYYFTPPIYSLDLGRKDVSGLAVFALSAVVVGWASAGRRRTLDQLRDARDATEAEVRARTADLKLTNLRLEAEIAERKRAQLEIEDLAGRLINAQEEERSRIGRELHDHISQRLGLLAIKIDQLRVDPLTPAGAEPAFDDLQQHTSEITRDVHGLSHRLHSSMLDYLGLVPALQRLVKEFSDRHGIAIEYRNTPPPTRVPSDVALCLFRVAEESLNNVVKHSHASSARVELTTGADGVRLTVEDSGDGFDPKLLEAGSGSGSGRAGLGFVSMRERLRLLRGTISVRTQPGHGTRIEAWVPAAAPATATPPAATPPAATPPPAPSTMARPADE
jgi:signal transduction histidine kinase